MTAELIVGENGNQNGPAQSGGYWGVALTPSVWIMEDQLEAVFSYQYANASKSEGFRISSHSARRAADAVDADTGMITKASTLVSIITFEETTLKPC